MFPNPTVKMAKRIISILGKDTGKFSELTRFPLRFCYLIIRGSRKMHDEAVRRKHAIHKARTRAVVHTHTCTPVSGQAGGAASMGEKSKVLGSMRKSRQVAQRGQQGAS